MHPIINSKLSALSSLGFSPLDIKELIEEEELLRLRDKASNDYLSYCQYTHNGIYKPNKLSKVLCSAIDDAVKESEAILDKVDKGISFTDGEGLVILLISLPPQHGKSMTIAETLPAYYISRNPDKTALLISYNQGSARRFGRRNRAKLEQYSPTLFNVSLDDSNSSVEDFGLQGYQGSIKSMGINGTITGNAGQLVIVDDPYKNGREAKSPTIRNNIQETFEDSIKTRLHPGSLLVVVHTRWHEDDLIAYLKSFYGDRAKVLSIPAECEDEASDPLNRKLGEFLWEEHHGKQYYLDNKRNSRVWNALYQQRPAPVDGATFIKSAFRSYNKKSISITNTTNIDYSIFKYVVMSWDCTFEGDSTSDYVAGQVWGYKESGDFYLIKRVKKQIDFVETRRYILDFINKYPQARVRLIERKANGHAIINQLEKVDNVKNIIGISPSESKEVRASAVSYFVNDGHVYLPDDDADIDSYIKEFGDFPFGKHDDEVDASTQAWSYIEAAINRKSNKVTSNK